MVPSGQKDPNGHASGRLAPMLADGQENPAGHGAGAEAKAGHKKPGGHARAVTAPDKHTIHTV